MKNTFITLQIFLFSLLATTALNAQMVVMLNHNGTSTPFYGNSGFTDAYTASVDGDTIYLPGRYYSTPSTIDKRLHIFGAGHYPDSSTATLVTQITSGFSIGENADSIHIEGLFINGSVTFTNNTSADYAVITRNYINGSVSFEGDRVTKPNYHSLISENVINGTVYCYNGIQTVVANNIILGILHSAENCLFSNNLIFGCSWWGYPYYNTPTLFRINNCVLENNVFNCGGVLMETDNNMFTKNIFTYTPGFGSNINNGNYLAVDFSTLFVNVPSATFNYAYNYHLQQPATYLGSDANEAGLYGGIHGPYKTASVPKNPHIQSKTIAPATTPAGDLNINIKVKAQDN